MSEEGEKYVAAFQAMRKFIEQVCLLLRTSDDIMGERNWKCFHLNVATHETTNILTRPRDWLPNVAFRFYKPTENETVKQILCTSLLLDDDEGEYEDFTEPLATMNLFQFANEIETGKVYDNTDYWWSRTFGYSDASPDGSIISEPGREIAIWFDEDPSGYILGNYSGIGLPHLEVQSEEDLRTKIIEPIFNMVD